MEFKKIITKKDSKENYYKKFEKKNLIWHDLNMVTER